MQSTIKSLLVPKPSGGLILPSAQAPAPRSIPVDWQSCDVETVKALAILTQCLMYQTLSADAFILAVYAAEDMCKKEGVSEAAWNHAVDALTQQYLKQRNRNPLSGMF